MTWRVTSILTGKADPFGPDGERSAIAKRPIDGPVRVGKLGIESDEQADLIHHGGLDKAIHHYPIDHYAFWRAELACHPLLEQPGAFGENISTGGLTEDNVCIGDRFALGSTVLEVSQGRQPCWNLAHRFDDKKVPKIVIRTGKGGWYYRVLEGGTIKPGDELHLAERPHPKWSVRRVFDLLIAGEAKRESEAAGELSELGALATNWRERAARFA